MIGDTSNYLALAVKPIDVATPLMQAQKIRQSQMDEQQQQIQMHRDAIGAEARGLAPLIGTPDYEPARQASTQRLGQMGILNNPQAQAGWERDSSSPLGIQSLIRRSQSAELAFRETEATRAQGNTDRAFTEGQRQFNVGRDQPAGFKPGSDGSLQPIPGGPQDPEFLRRQHEATDKPQVVPAGASLVKGEKTVFTSASAMSEGAKEMTARQVINGDLSGLQNIGRGAQGNEILTGIKNKAAEILMSENGMSATEAAAHLGAKLQAFKASTTEQTTGARTRASREENLNLILKATEAAIPAALEASEVVARTGWVPINRIIQKGEVIASSAPLKMFGMANLQLAEHWARAMNPTGVMRESDRDKALTFLDTADSKETYKQLVMQLHKQITRERDSIHGKPSDAQIKSGPPPEPGDKAQDRVSSSPYPPPPAGFQLVK